MVFALSGGAENDEAIAAAVRQNVVERFGEVVGFLFGNAHNAIGIACAHIFAHRIAVAHDHIGFESGINTGVGRTVAAGDVIGAAKKV